MELVEQCISRLAIPAVIMFSGKYCHFYCVVASVGTWVNGYCNVRIARPYLIFDVPEIAGLMTHLIMGLVQN